MVTDRFGLGSFIQHALVDGEGKENLRSAVHSFKKNNPSWSKIRVFGIDKQFTELALLQEEFPCATVILCHFHVIDYLSRQVSKVEFGFDSFTKMHLKNLFPVMVRADNSAEFDRCVTALRKLCRKGEDDEKTKFLEYFDSNWMSCQALWCKHLRGSIPHLDNHTNNRLEASWGVSKQVLENTMPMDECIQHLLLLQKDAENAYTLQVSQVGYRHNIHHDAEMKVLAQIASCHACELIQSEYKISLNCRCRRQHFNPLCPP